MLCVDLLEIVFGGLLLCWEYYVVYDVILKMEVVDFDFNLVIISIM